MPMLIFRAFECIIFRIEQVGLEFVLSGGVSMSDTVKKVFGVLIIVVVMVIIGGVLLNVLLPNTMHAAVDWVEQGIESATGAQIDLDGQDYNGAQQDPNAGYDGGGVEGYEGFTN